MSSFIKSDKAVLTVMITCTDPETAIETMRKAVPQGAEAFGIQTEKLGAEYWNEKTFRRIFAAGEGLPFYVTSYRSVPGGSITDEETAKRLLLLAQSGAQLCDVMGDLFSKHPEELTEDSIAIEKQIRLIDELHARGASVLMSSHVHKYLPPERVLEFALEQKRRGADVIKIVTDAKDVDEELDNLAAARLLQKELGAPFLFLSGGECSVLRRLGWKLGCNMILCVYEHDQYSTKLQPTLAAAKAVRDEMGF